MKSTLNYPCNRLAKPLALALQLSFYILHFTLYTSHAAVPVAWTNSPGMPPYPINPVPHGSTVDLAVTLKGYTTPPIADGADVRLWYQTNGMDQAWWSAPATFDGSTITASFGPAQDCGADRVSLFFGAPSNVFASAILRLTHAPGFTPSSLPLPVPTLDFSAVELRNLAALTNGWSFGSTPGNYSVVSNAAMSAAPAYKGVPELVSCDWHDGNVLLKWYENEGIWHSLSAPPRLGGQKSLAYNNGQWRYMSGSVPDEYAFTNAVPVYGFPPTLTLFQLNDVDASVTLTRTNEVWSTNRYPVAYADDLPEWPVQLITTNAPLIFADGQDTNVASIALQAQPTNHTSLSFLHPVSYYLPNRFSLFELGNDYQIVGSQWFQVGRYLYAQNPENIVFVGGGRHRSLQDYLDACAPETLVDLLSCYVPTNGGGRIHGDLEIDGRLTAGELITITNSDIHAKGFQVVDKVLTADGLTASNGMVRLNCARFVLGFGTPRVHVETNDLGSAVTYGGTWDHPSGNLSTFYSGKIEEVLAGNVNEADIEKRNPYMTYGAVKLHFTGWEIKTHGVNTGPIKRYTLENYRTHYFGDENVGSGGIELNLQSNAHVRIVYDFAQTAPSAVYFEWGYEGGAEVRANGTQLSSPTAGACTLIEIEHLSGNRYLVTEHDMSTTYTTSSYYDEVEP